jgi:hypothetical protein
VFIAGATPWTWWASQRLAFSIASIVALGLFVGGLLLGFERRRWRSVA